MNQSVMQVLEWIVEGGIHPSSEMYSNIFTFAQRSCGAEYASAIQERIGKSSFLFPIELLLDLVDMLLNMLPIPTFLGLCLHIFEVPSFLFLKTILFAFDN